MQYERNDCWVPTYHCSNEKTSIRLPQPKSGLLERSSLCVCLCARAFSLFRSICNWVLQFPLSWRCKTSDYVTDWEADRLHRQLLVAAYGGRDVLCDARCRRSVLKESVQLNAEWVRLYRVHLLWFEFAINHESSAWLGWATGDKCTRQDAMRR